MARAPISYRFDGKNERAQLVAEQHAAKLVTVVSAETRAAIRALITRAIKEGIAPYDAARMIRSMVGMTVPQARAAMRYREALVEQGLTPDKVDASVERYTAKKIRERAENIARTEIMTSLNAGAEEGYRQAVEDGLLEPGALEEWMVTPDDRLCDECAAMDGETTPVGQPFAGGVRPPLHPGCLPGDCLVSPCGGIAGITERRYEGQIVTIQTAAGHELTCTPNHPVLTDRGWVPASSLDVGSHVVSLLRGDWPPMIHDDHEYVPARIEDVARAFREETGAFSRRMPVAPEDFHGDGFGSDVAVVGAYGLLGDGAEAAISEQPGEPRFAIRLTPESLNRLGAAAELLLCSVGATDCGMSRGDLSLPGLSAHAAPLDGFASALVARLNAMGEEESPHCRTRNAEPLGDAVLRLAGQVGLDQVLRLLPSDCSGHVYNLQTMSGLYIGNGIVVHNCRCTFAVTAERA